MTNADAARARALYEQIGSLQRELAALQRTAALGSVTDETFRSADGPVALSQLFGDGPDLVMIHNMGRRCAYCTMWADGFAGLARHLERRAALVLVSPDPPEVQRAFAEARGWPFRMVSTGGSSPLERALGFETDAGRMPGYSTFRKGEDGAIHHVASDFFGPGDVYNGAWHVFARLEGGAGDWQPRI